MLKIKLTIDNKESEFVAPFISARILKNTIKQFGDAKNKTDENTIDDMINYIVDIFGKQFTFDQLLDGIAGDELIPKFTECIEKVTGNLKEKTSELAAAQGKNE